MIGKLILKKDIIAERLEGKHLHREKNSLTFQHNSV